MVCLLQSWYTDTVMMIVCCSCNMCPSVELLASYYKTYSEIIIKTKRLTITINMFTLFFTFVCVLVVTAVARKRPRSFCQKRRWQVTAKHAYTLRMWLHMK